MQSVTIITGALLSQVLLGIIMFVGASILNYSSNNYGSRFDYKQHGLNGFILFLLLCSVATLLSTQSLSEIWIGLFKGTSFVGITDSSAMLVVFLLNVCTTFFLVALTGGSTDSPFQPIFFLIPTLSLLLYEPTNRVVLYSILSAAGFVSLMFIDYGMHSVSSRGVRPAYGFVTLACLALAVLIGVLTRVCPAGTC